MNPTRHSHAGLQIVSSLRDLICMIPNPALPCRATDCVVPSGLDLHDSYPALPCRATDCIVPSGLDLHDSYPGPPVPGYRLCRPFGTRFCMIPNPALPCRATDCVVPSGLDLHDSFPALPCRAIDCVVPSGLIPSGDLRFFSQRLHPIRSRELLPQGVEGVNEK